MKNGFIKAAAGTPLIEVADCGHNSQEILRLIKEMEKEEVKVMVFPELCLTGYTCGDLFYQSTLLDSAKKSLFWLADETKDTDALIVVGLPVEVYGRIYNAAAFLNKGKVIGLVPKTYVPNHGDYCETRQFAPAQNLETVIILDETEVPFGTKLLFECPDLKELVIACEIGEDLWVPAPPSTAHAAAGATVIVNLSAEGEITGKDVYRRQLVNGQSARLICGYIFAGAGEGESTADEVFAAHNLICEDGTVLAEAKRFRNETVYADLDVKRICSERRKTSTYPTLDREGYRTCSFRLEQKETKLTRTFDPHPFIPGNESERVKRCEEIFMIQAMGLKKRLTHTHSNSAVIGISGGLDSTLALLVITKAYDLLGWDRSGIQTVTMPCFGTTDRTYNNACNLAKMLGTSFREVNIKEAVTQHFKDIGHEMDKHDVTFENAQARERTQVLMDIANQTNGLVVGTGDLSELALGWATYNGDHMSMYCVNGSVPKTLVRHLVRYYADTCGKDELKTLLLDILDTPVSPELLPPKDGEIVQKTEDLVGPYELHDYFLYYMLRVGYEPDKIYRIAKKSFEGVYDNETILKWLRNFYRRFFTQQFKRSCLPEGPKVGTVGVSPRGDLKMPSDATSKIWMDIIDTLK